MEAKNASEDDAQNTNVLRVTHGVLEESYRSMTIYAGVEVDESPSGNHVLVRSREMGSPHQLSAEDIMSDWTEDYDGGIRGVSCPDSIEIDGVEYSVEYAA